MPIKNTITFPATNAEGEAKLKRLIETLSAFMRVETKIETVIVLQATVPPDRMDMALVLSKIAAGQNKKVLDQPKSE